MKALLEYEELRIRVRPVGASRYLVAANGPACATDVIAVGGEPAACRERWDRLIAAELGLAPMGEEHTAAQLRQLGRDVFGLLLGGTVGACVEVALERAQSMQPPRGLRLRFDLPPELRGLPVEALCAPPSLPQQSLALNHAFSLVRSLPGNPLGRRLPDPEDEPSRIRLLVASASPADASLPPLRTDFEVEALRRQLPAVAVRTTVLEPTRRGLERALDAPSGEPAVVLLIAHGVYDHELGKGVVCLESEDGGVDRVPADLLSGILLKAQQVRLVVLNLCSGADSTRFEPFSGLAQALIGGGVPAVVAMRGRVSDASAGVFGPALLKGLVSNCTIDECMSAARRSISHLPDHTAVEWATPTLFLHEAYRQGWLFKAREVRDEHDTAPDPLREGAEALGTFQRPTGHVDSAVVITAARFLRARGQWSQVQRVLQTDLQRFADEQRYLRAEAAMELAWPEMDRLCELLAAEEDPADAARQLAALRGMLPGGPCTCLVEEVDQHRRLTELLVLARAAQARADWSAALSAYEEVLAARPTFKDAVDGHAAVCGELQLDRGCREAEQARRSGDWDRAARAYAEVLGVRPDHRDALAGAAYVSGRIAEDGGHWREAASEYARCPGVDDCAARSAYVRGRRAAEEEDWPQARDAFAQAVELGYADDGWRAHAAGRAAEADRRWTAAAEAFAAVPDFRDSSVRLLVARGHSAMERCDWSQALELLEAAAAEGWPVEPSLSRVRERVYESAVEAEAAADWAAALSGFGCLPGDYRDSRARWRYAEGRTADALGDWWRAAEAYTDCDHADAQVRRGYALGRGCEEKSRWEQAQEHFAALPPHLLDVSDRLLYVRGSIADARADWPGVIEGFGRLPDVYAEGDVGSRRLHARARIAEGRGEWESVLSLLADVPDDDRDGAVGVLRRKAAGRQAEDSDDWARAVGFYAAAAADEELRLLHDYALGRAHECGGRWDEALSAYQGLPDVCRDVVARRAHIQAVLAERAARTAADWREVVARLQVLAPDFEDVAVRAGYARARLAEADGDWEAALREAGALGAYRDAPLIGGYARGRLAESRQEWQQAADAYLGCTEHQDAAVHLAYVEGRLLEADGRWRAAIAAYERARGEHDRADVRCRRLLRLLDLLPWADGPTGAPLVADPFALQDPTFPYLALRDAGVGPGASMDVVHDASYTLMERGGMTWPERVAWDRLRLPGRRLQLDALLYRWSDPEALRDQLAALSPDGAPDLLDTLCRRLPRDTPLLLLLARGREAAIAEWQERLREAPGDMAVVHGLAVAHLWQAQETEQSGAWEHAVRAWEFALAYWATLLTDDGYWDQWRTQRAACYERVVSPEDVARLRWELGQHLFDQLTAYEQRHTEQDRPEQAGAYAALSDLLEAELGGARVLGDVGGLPSAQGKGGGPACGPGYLRLMHLEGRLGELVARLDEAARGGQDPGEYAVRELRWAFSELSAAATFSGVHKFEQARRALPAPRTLTSLPADCAGPASAGDPDAHIRECGHCQDFLRRNPAYLHLPGRHARLLQDSVDLAVHVRLALARTALTGGDGGPDRALEEWAEAVRLSKNAGMQARTKRAVVHMVLGRAGALAEEEGRQLGACVDEAVGLIERVLPLLLPLDRTLLDQLDAKLSGLLSLRGVWRGYTCTKFGIRPDIEAAHHDLRRGLALNPESTYARDNLARALVFTLDERTDSDRGRLAVIHEALEILHVGLEKALAHGFRETLGEALVELENLLTKGLGVHELSAMMQRISQERAPADGDLSVWARELADKAEEELRRGGVRAGLQLQIRATRADPSNGRVRRALLDTTGRWLAELAGEGNEEP